MYTSKHPIYTVHTPYIHPTTRQVAFVNLQARSQKKKGETQASLRNIFRKRTQVGVTGSRAERSASHTESQRRRSTEMVVSKIKQNDAVARKQVESTARFYNKAAPLEAGIRKNFRLKKRGAGR